MSSSIETKFAAATRSSHEEKSSFLKGVDVNGNSDGADADVNHAQ
jgi:hypothetical protein